MIADRWGVRDDEVCRHYPCDEFVPSPVLEAWRGVTVRTDVDDLWRWIGQLRLGPYSYDWIDNLGRRSPRRLHGLPAPVVGENFSTAFGRPAGRIVAVEPGMSLTGTIVGATMSYVLVPEPAGTRLLLKVVTARGRFIAPALQVGDLIMARRQLLNLKERAEASGNNPGGGPF
jgi:hypothetical protein